MDYHARKRIEDDVLRMPANGYAFKEIVAKWLEFTDEPRNVRLSLENDGVNLRYVCSVWPIFVIDNKIPPWISIKR
jgi:hypothetical protein